MADALFSERGVGERAQRETERYNNNIMYTIIL